MTLSNFVNKKFENFHFFCLADPKCVRKSAKKQKNRDIEAKNEDFKIFVRQKLDNVIFHLWSKNWISSSFLQKEDRKMVVFSYRGKCNFFLVRPPIYFKIQT